MYPFYLGIDVHLKRSFVVLMDNTGHILDKRRLRNNEFEQYLKDEVPHDTYAVLEATRNWPFVYDLLEDHVERVELAHPKEVTSVSLAGKAIASAVLKDDPIDSKTLAHLARLNRRRRANRLCSSQGDSRPAASHASPRTTGAPTHSGEEPSSCGSGQLQHCLTRDRFVRCQRS